MTRSGVAVRIGRRGVVHAVADCRGCSWKCEDYKTAQWAARKHAGATGHTVRVEVCSVYAVSA